MPDGEKKEIFMTLMVVLLMQAVYLNGSMKTPELL